MYKVAICDDEESYRKKIKNYLLKEESIQDNIEIFEYIKGQELLDNIGIYHNMIILNIQLVDINGNPIANTIRNENKNAVLVFCANYDKLTPDTLKFQPFRYIKKNSSNCILEKDISLIVNEMLKKTHINMLPIIGDGYVRKIPIDDILYIEIKRRGSRVYVYENRGIRIWLSKQSLDEMYELTRDFWFEYAHCSYIVNLDNVTRIDKSVVCLKGKITLNVSRSKKKQFDARLAEFLAIRHKRIDNL